MFFFLSFSASWMLFGGSKVAHKLIQERNPMQVKFVESISQDPQTVLNMRVGHSFSPSLTNHGRDSRPT